LKFDFFTVYSRFPVTKLDDYAENAPLRFKLLKGICNFLPV
jgi:hypothetical protein